MKFRVMGLELNDSGLGFYTIPDLFEDLGKQASPFTGHYVQLVRAECWGAYGISGGTVTRQVLTMLDMQTGISVTDRGALDKNPRVGLEWPLAARRVYSHLETEQIIQLTSNNGAGAKAEFYLLLTIIGW